VAAEKELGAKRGEGYPSRNESGQEEGAEEERWMRRDSRSSGGRYWWRWGRDAGRRGVWGAEEAVGGGEGGGRVAIGSV